MRSAYLRTAVEWCAEISRVWGRGAANTFELARLVSQAKSQLRYGEWGRLWQSKRLFSRRKAQMLLVIGRELELVQNSAQLPSAWNTLYHLARLGRTTVERLIAEGSIHPDLTLKEAKALLAEHGIAGARTPPGARPIQRITRFASFVRSTLGSWSREERRLVHARLLELAEEVRVGGSSLEAVSPERDQSKRGSPKHTKHASAPLMFRVQPFPSLPSNPRHPQPLSHDIS